MIKRIHSNTSHAQEDAKHFEDKLQHNKIGVDGKNYYGFGKQGSADKK